MKTKILVLLCLFLLLMGPVSQAQVDSVYTGKPRNSQVREKEIPKFDWKDRLSFGGSFMAWFGSSQYVYLSPTAYLRLTDRLFVSLGGIYNYNSISNGPIRMSYSIYGFQTSAMTFLTKSLFAKVEYNRLYQPDYWGMTLNDRLWVDYLLVGGGFSQRMGDKAALYTSIMWNIVDSPQTYFYPNPIIQIGIMAGF